MSDGDDMISEGSPIHIALDEAWGDAEAALPEGWRIKEVRLFDDATAWSAEAENLTGEGRYRWVAQGPTPAEAIFALAMKLRKEFR